VPDNFVMDDAKCSGKEVRLEDCEHNARDNCGTNEGAGVVCRAPSTTATTTAKTTTTKTDTQKEEGKSNRGLHRGRVGWLILGALAAVVSLFLFVFILQKYFFKSSPSKKTSTFKILLLVLMLFLLTAGLGLGVGLRPRHFKKVEWFVWALLVVVGVLLTLCFGLLIEKQRRMRNERKRVTREENRKDMGPKETTELSTCQGSGITNDGYVPEVPSAPPLYPPIPNCEADEEPAMTQLIAQLLSSTVEKIAREKAGLECPVCLETANIPIYTCPKQHLICSECRPKVIYIFNIAFCTFADSIDVSIIVMVKLTITSHVL